MTNIHPITPHVRHVDAPPALRTLPAWLIWRFEANGEKKPRKVPYYAGGGRRAGVQGSEADVAGLVTFEAAKAAAARRGFDGVGFATLGQWGITALDFDDCITPAGLHHEVAEVVAATYAEYSPSGKGIRAFFRGQLPTGKSHKQGDLPYGFEVFSTSGFVTFTGNALPECEILGTDDVVADIDDTVRALHARRFPAARPIENADRPQPIENVDRLGLGQEDLQLLLAALPDDLDYDSWVEVGMAVHHETNGEGFELWDEWSRQSPKYTTPEYGQERWRSFSRGTGAVLTARSLVHMANKHGAGFALHPAASSDEFPDEGEIARQEQASAAAEAAKPLRFQFEPASGFASATALPWIIKGILPQAGLAVLYGASGAGKSFAILDMAMAIARGCEWRKRKVRAGGVCYVAAEGAGGFRKRLTAYAQANELDLAGLPFWVLGAAPNLMEPQDAKDLIKGIRALGQPVSMIVVDTLAQATPGANENAGEDMGKALGYCKRIHAATGALVLLVHHSGKDQAKGARGWSGIRAACDAELEVTRELTGRCIRLTKSKDGEDGLEFGFDLDVVQLGVDEDLDPITSCVVVEAAVPPVGGVPARKMGRNEALVNEVVQEMAQAQTEGIEREAVIVEAARRMMVRDGKEGDSKGNFRRSAARALASLCKGDDAPYWLDEENDTLSVM